MNGSPEDPDSSPTDHPPATDEAVPAAPSHTRRLRWWVAAITFVGGALVGVVAVGLLSAGTPAFGTAPGGAPAPSSGVNPGPGGGIPLVAQAEVNAACLSVINEAQDTYTVLTDVGQAANDVDLQRLDDIVRRLQPIEARLGQDLPNCRVDTSLQPGSGGSTTQTPFSQAPISPSPEPAATR